VHGREKITVANPAPKDWRNSFQPRRELGRTGFKATVLGIGDLADRNVPLDRCVATIHRAMDAGLNLIDTAPSYEEGYSEQIVGAALNGRRDGMFVIDKIDHHHEPVVPQVDASLRKTGLAMIDCFVFHGLSTMDDWRKIVAPGSGMDQLASCIQTGKVRFRGISSHHPDVLLAAVPSGLCDLVMFPVGPFVDPRYIQQILPLAQEHRVGTVCFKTFAAGKLLGDTPGYNQPLQARPRGKLSSGGSDAPTEPTLPRMSVAECLHYTLMLDPDVALLGLSFPNEQDAAYAAVQSFQTVSSEQMSETCLRAAKAIQGKGPCWWNPPAP
jgi:aryl-alcohol dehydrogenase-like predicted oxidoreductase